MHIILTVFVLAICWVVLGPRVIFGILVVGVLAFGGLVAHQYHLQHTVVAEEDFEKLFIKDDDAEDEFSKLLTPLEEPVVVRRSVSECSEMMSDSQLPKHLMERVMNRCMGITP